MIARRARPLAGHQCLLNRHGKSTAMPWCTISQSNPAHPKDSTMKMHALLLATVLLAGCSQAPNNAPASKAASTGDTKVPAVASEPGAGETPAMAAEATAATKASATGTVQAVDAAAGKITIAHGPVDALHWPAMTMGFKATPEQVSSVQAGQKVQFEFESTGMDATITQITQAE